MDVTRKSARKWIDSLSLRVQQALFAAAAYLILLAICLLAISPEQYDLSVGDVAPKTITASKDIVDELTTERRRQAAADAVSPVYYKDDTVSDTVLSDMDAVFSELRAVRELGEQIRNAWGDEGGAFTEADYAQASGLVTRLSLSNYQLRTLMNTGESDFESLYQSLVSATRTTLVSTITEGQINDAINNIQQIVSYNTRTDLWYNVAIPTLRASLKANMLIDQAATEENRQKACDAVEPTVYKQDQNIVVKGDRVTAEQIAVLESLGLLEGNSFDYPLYIGTAITLALILASAYLYAYLFAKPMLSMGPSALVLLIAGVLTVLLCLLMGEYLNINAMPVALGAMLAVNLLGARPAYVTNMALTLIVTLLTAKGTGLVTSQTMSVLLTCSLGGLVAIWMMRKNTTRVMVVVSGLVVGAVNFGVLVCVRALMRFLKEHVVVKMHVAESHKAADRHALDDIGPDDVGKALAGRKDLPAPALVQQRAEAADEVRGIVVDQAPERLLRRLFGGGELAAEMVVELAVAIEAQPLAHLHDARRGQIVLRSDLLDAHALLAALDVRRDAGDHLPLILRQQIRQQKIIVAHKNSSSTAPTRSNSLHYKISRSYVKKSVRRTRPASITCIMFTRQQCLYS